MDGEIVTAGASTVTVGVVTAEQEPLDTVTVYGVVDVGETEIETVLAPLLHK